MTMNPRSEKDNFRGKKEISDPDYGKFPKNNIITSSSSRQWSSTYKNPRIVRVSRAFGGKDRHSKVCTVRGLRDRRIRLSVPTAIQLYDLQERLGLSQPSKVVDWLMDATKHEIDKLPPLPMLPIQSPDFLNSNHPNKELETKTGSEREKEKWVFDQQENQDQGFGGFNQNYQLFPFLSNNNNQSSCNFPNMPYNFHWEPPTLSLSQFGGGFPAFPINQTEYNPTSSQMHFFPSATNLPSVIPTFPSFITPSVDNHELRQINHVQQNPALFPTTLHLISSPMKSFMLNVNSKVVNSQENNSGRPDKDRKNS